MSVNFMDTTRNRKVYLVSLGCDKNRVDGEVMIGNLRNAGFTVTNDPSEAQAIIVNTCGFIRDAVQESIDLVLELAAYKSDGSCNGLIIVGCMSERYRGEIQESIPEADAILGVKEYDRIAEVVSGLIGSPGVDLPEVGLPDSSDNGASVGSNPFLSRMAARSDDAIPHVAYVKISEGCDNHCTYCTIPSIRGAYTSRSMEHILEECKQLVAAGVCEIVLVAQDTALYGTDNYGEKRLPELLRKIAALSSGIWIRLMYAYPEHITTELIQTMAEIPQICKYVDMPIQHSEDSVLARMGRSSSRAALTTLIAELREKIPDIAIRTTVMVGFPGETTDDFKNLYRFVQEIKFDRMGAFPYSREEGTPAATMPQQLKPETKQARLERIMALQQEIHFAKQAALVGETLDVIIDLQDENGEYIARTQHDAFEVDAVVYVESNEILTHGQFCKVKITSANQYDLRGHGLT